MKEILVMSAGESIDFVLNSSCKDFYVIISIQDSQNGLGLVFTKTIFCKDVLTLYFDDVDRITPGLQIFNKDHAEQIVNFTRKNENVEKFIVHCTYGESRSYAVAHVIAAIYGLENIISKNDIFPNRYVQNLLTQAFKSDITPK